MGHCFCFVLSRFQNVNKQQLAYNPIYFHCQLELQKQVSVARKWLIINTNGYRPGAGLASCHSAVVELFTSLISAVVS